MTLRHKTIIRSYQDIAPTTGETEGSKPGSPNEKQVPQMQQASGKSKQQNFKNAFTKNIDKKKEFKMKTFFNLLKFDEKRHRNFGEQTVFLHPH